MVFYFYFCFFGKNSHRLYHDFVTLVIFNSLIFCFVLTIFQDLTSAIFIWWGDIGGWISPSSLDSKDLFGF